MSTINQDFLHGFAEATGLTRPEAETEWAGFSYQLTTEERENLVNGGFEAGRAEGARFRRIYAENEAELAVAGTQGPNGNTSESRCAISS